MAQVFFKLNRRGELVSSRHSEVLGPSALDNAALETIRRGQPFAPPPAELKIGKRLISPYLYASTGGTQVSHCQSNYACGRLANGPIGNTGGFLIYIPRRAPKLFPCPGPLHTLGAPVWPGLVVSAVFPPSPNLSKGLTLGNGYAPALAPPSKGRLILCTVPGSIPNCLAIFAAGYYRTPDGAIL